MCIYLFSMTVVQWYRAPPMAHLNEMWRAQHHSAVCVIPMVLCTVSMEGQNWFACVCVFRTSLPAVSVRCRYHPVMNGERDEEDKSGRAAGRCKKEHLWRYLFDNLNINWKIRSICLRSPRWALHLRRRRKSKHGRQSRASVCYMWLSLKHEEQSTLWFLSFLENSCGQDVLLLLSMNVFHSSVCVCVCPHPSPI